MKAVVSFLNRVFQREEMDGDGRCPTYLVRWTLLKFWGGRSLYLHHFVGDDWALDLHDHPKRFVSIGLWGGYIEETPSPKLIRAVSEDVYRAPWIRTFPATHVHRLRMLAPGAECWTLVAVLKPMR